MGGLPACLWAQHLFACFPWRPEEGPELPGARLELQVVVSHHVGASS